MTERCINRNEQDPDWQRAYFELLDLWGTADRAVLGRGFDDEDAQALSTLQGAIAARQRVRAVMRAWGQVGAPKQPDDIPPLWQLNYADALVDALKQLTGQQATIDDIYGAFGLPNPTDIDQMTHLVAVAKKATAMSEQRGRDGG